MARTYTGNQDAANAARSRKAQERKADELRAAGWTCTPPEQIDMAALQPIYDEMNTWEVRNHLHQVHGHGLDIQAAAALELHAWEHKLHDHGHPDPHINPEPDTTPKAK